MELQVNPVLNETPDLRHAVRRLRWFASSFRSEVSRLSDDIGVPFRIEDRKVAQAFVAWLRAFKAQRPAADRDPRGFTYFAAGLMVRELVRHQPVALLKEAAWDENADPAHFWPEGYAYVSFCMGVCSAVLKQEFGEELDPHPQFWDRRTWWSFRENAQADADLAIGFFDLFCGVQPDWMAPAFFDRRSGPDDPQAGSRQALLS